MFLYILAFASVAFLVVVIVIGVDVVPVTVCLHPPPPHASPPSEKQLSRLVNEIVIKLTLIMSIGSHAAGDCTFILHETLQICRMFGLQ